MKKYCVQFLAATLALLCAGCAGGVLEKHHFATVNTSTNEIVNVFRVTVTGDVQAANARYLAGYYDERAVDLFFNETKSRPVASGRDAQGAPQFWDWDCSGKDADACKAHRESRLSVVPVGGGEVPEGAFFLLLSTNADAVASTIGGFAENEVLLKAALSLATRDTRQEAARARAAEPYLKAARAGVFEEIELALQAGGQTGRLSNEAERTAYYLGLLERIASGITGGQRPRFSTLAEAQAWYAVNGQRSAP